MRPSFKTGTTQRKMLATKAAFTSLGGAAAGGTAFKLWQWMTEEIEQAAHVRLQTVAYEPRLHTNIGRSEPDWKSSLSLVFPFI